MLNKVLVTPMGAEVALLPLIIHVQQSEMISTRSLRSLTTWRRWWPPPPSNDIARWPTTSWPSLDPMGTQPFFFRVSLVLRDDSMLPKRTAVPMLGPTSRAVVDRGNRNGPSRLYLTPSKYCIVF